MKFTKFAYEDLGDDQFEKLIVILCQHLFGISVQPFASGPDGGRDAKFVGTAELHPSKSSPWVGTTIIQAKHTSGYNHNFGDTDFFNPPYESTVIGKEIPRIKNLRKNKMLDNYMMISNRRLPANVESNIRAHLAKECGIPEQSIFLCGIEQLELWLKFFPQVAIRANLDPIDSPLSISPDDLSDIVQVLGLQIDNISAVLDKKPVNRVPYAEKNELNNMTVNYAKELIKKYLKDTAQIKVFLAAPENLELLRKYEAVVEEFQFKIIAKRHSYQSFDEVMEYLLDILFNRDAILRQSNHRRLTRTMLFYMYWNCDIGEVPEDATTN